MNREIKNKILDIAYKSILHFIENKELISDSQLKIDEIKELKDKRGAFVLLKDKESDELIAYEYNINSKRSLYLNIRDLAVKCIKRDFKDILSTVVELNKIKFQIILPYNLKACRKKENIEKSSQGICIQYMNKTAATVPFLINKKEKLDNILQNLCIEAELQKDFYLNDNLILFTFDILNIS
ncbi:MAG: AMMECR1 domain-containing protein [Candidatus Muiribacteriota bacterium]